MRYITPKKNLNCYSLSKDRSKSHFWLQGPINGARRGVLEKFVLFRYSLALTSIFIIKVDFSANTDILTWVHDTLSDEKIMSLGDFIVLFCLKNKNKPEKIF